MKTIFLVYQLAAGDGLGESMLHAALGDGLRVCAFRKDENCCGAVACRRASEFDRAGYRLFLQKSADDGSLEIPKSGDLIVMQLREPTMRALACYRDDLSRRGRAHSVETLQSFLADEAIRTIDFSRKWDASGGPRRFVLRNEELAARPRDTLEALLSAAGLQADDAELARAAALAPPDAAGEVSLRTLEANPDFLRPYFAEFMNLLAEETDYLGYPLWQEHKPASGPVTTIYRARRALADGRFEEALSVLAPFVAVSGPEPELRAMLAEALLEAGREVEGRRAIDSLIKSHPDHFDAYAILARHAHRLGLSFELRGVLREAMARRGGMAWTQCFLEKTRLDPDLLREFPQTHEPPVSRASVVSGFTWILGRKPESEAVVEGHRHLHDDDELRASLLRSQEFREFYERFTAGFETAPSEGAGATREDVLQALRWLMGRPLRSRDEAMALLDIPSPAALRLRLVGDDEFAQAYRHFAEDV